MLRSLVGSEMCIRDRQELGLWKDDVARIVGALGGPRRLVASWTPFISKLPVRNLSLSQFFLISPVPNLASHVPVLTAEGFGHIACFKSISESDFGVMPSIPWGHKLTMLRLAMAMSCLLYTSDAADEEDSVDLGGRRIIKKKKNESKIR
eukprot:TRINITY_DN25260_c0_g1_i1.p1 TRINITY_DN25260_c0_g1~~TRINITY_DN25260_c0_g1_i1.p1  ORF type:complete len:150 (-),score=39.36 TRINITY_DN25260_c0_g1_i1:47-496(-)